MLIAGATDLHHQLTANTTHSTQGVNKAIFRTRTRDGRRTATGCRRPPLLLRVSCKGSQRCAFSTTARSLSGSAAGKRLHVLTVMHYFIVNHRRDEQVRLCLDCGKVGRRKSRGDAGRSEQDGGAPVAILAFHAQREQHLALSCM